MNGRRLRVLFLCDATHSHAQLIAQLGSIPHFDIRAASDIDAALSPVNSRDYDVVLIDLARGPRASHRRASSHPMPIAEIKRRFVGVPCIALVGRGAQARVAALRDGVSHAFSRPVVLEELAAAIEQAAEHSRSQPTERSKDGERRAVEKLAAIHRISTAISSLRELDGIFAATCRAAVELFDVDHSGLVLFEPDGSHGRVTAEFPATGTQGLIIPVRGVLTEERLVQSGEAIILSDSMSDPALGEVVEIWRRFDIRSVLIVPVIFQGLVLGSFSLDTIGRSHEFSGDEIDLCQIFAAQIAVAIEHAKLFADVRQRADQLEMVRQTTLAITSQLDRGKLLRAIIQQAVALLHASSGGIYEYHPERGALVIVADYGRPDELRGKELQVGEGMAGQLIASGEPFLIVNDYNQWPGRAHIYDNNRTFGAVIEIPLKWQEQIIGVLYVDDQIERVFTVEDANLLQLFVDHAAIALVNANLTAQETSKRRRLEQLATASSEIVDNLGSLSPGDRLNLIAQHATVILQAECCGIFLVKRPGILSLEASHGHREGAFEKGKEFEIRSGPRSGITGHIAFLGQLFSAYGDALTSHPALRSTERNHTPSGACCSLLAIPLKRRRGDQEELIGLLRVDNKKHSAGEATPAVGFSQEDEWFLRLFAHAAVVAIEDARLVAALNEQRDYLDRLVASLPNGVIAIDLDQNVTRFNQQAEAMLHYTEAEVLGQPVEPLYNDPYEPRRIGRLLHTAGDRRLAGYETVIRSKEGDRIPIRLTATWIYNALGERIGSVGHFEDLRSIKETERRLALLLEASNIVARAENLVDGLHSLADMMVRLLKTTFCRVFLLDEHQQFLIPHAVSAIDRSDQLDWTPGLGMRTAVADWPDMVQFLNDGQPKVLLASRQRSQKILAEWARRLNLDVEIQSLLVIPLRAGDRVVGLIDLGELRGWGRAAFTSEKLDLAAAIAGQAAILIDRMLLAEIGERRERLLANLDTAARHIRALKEPVQLQQEIVRLAIELVDAQVGGLFVCRPQLQELELMATYGFEESLSGAQQPYSEGLIGQVARFGVSICAHDYTNWTNQDTLLAFAGLQTVVAVPLRQSGGVTAVLFVGGSTSIYQFGESSVEILERFAVHAASVLQTARLIGAEQRMASQLTILHKISDYIQAASDLDNILQVVLTGITAGYGLRFNRAAVLLLDRRREQLIGQMGIGQIEEHEALADWERHELLGLEDFGRFLKLLEAGMLAPTPICERIRALQMPLGAAASDVLGRAVAEAQAQIVSQDDLAALPFSFIESFGPALPLVVAPLIARDQVIGLLVADNKFTGMPITHETVDTLMTFANTAAVAIDNIRLRQEAESIGGQLRTFYEASNALVSAQDPEKVLQETVERACVAAQAYGVNVVLIDERAKVRRLITAGSDQGTDLSKLVRPNGISMQVMHTGVPAIIEDVHAQRERVNPSMFVRGVSAALCIPVLLEGRRIGVMWFHYDRPRTFAAAEIDTIGLYVNQAAVAYDNARRIKELSKAQNAAVVVARVMALGQSQITLREVVEGTQDVLGCDAISLYVYDHDPGRLIHPPVTTGLWYPQRPIAPRGIESDPLVHEMLQRDDLYVVENTVADRFFHSHRFTHEERIVSCVAIPLRGRAERVGVMFVHFRTPHHFTGDELASIQHFAHQASVAIHNAQLYERLQKRAAALQALYEAGRAVTSSLDQADILQRIVEQAWRLTNSEGRHISFANIRIVDKTMARAVAVYPLERMRQIGGLVDIDLRRGKNGRIGIMGRAIQTGESQLVGDTTCDPDYLPSDHETRSELAVPIWLGDKVIGAINVENSDYDAFDHDDQRAIESLATQAAIALRNGQLYDQMGRRVAALQALSEASRVVTGTLSLPETLDRLAEQVCRVMDYRGRQAHFSLLALRKGNQLHFTSTYPLAMMDQLRARIGPMVDLANGWNGRIGVTGRVAVSGRSELIADISTHDDYIAYADGMRSELAVPMKIRDEVIGVINIEHPELDAFDEDDQRVLEALAAQAAVGIENARLFAEVQQRVEQFRMLYESSLSLTAELSVEVVLQEVVNRARQLTTAQYGALGVLDVNGAIWPFITSGLEPKAIRGIAPPSMAHGLLDRLLRAPEVIRSTNIHEHPDFTGYAADHPAIGSFLGLPILYQGQVIGNLYVANKQADAEFSGADEEILQLLAAQAAVAIQNARQFGQIKKATERLTAIHQISIAAASRQEAQDQILQAAIHEMVRVFDADRGGIVLFDPDGDYGRTIMEYPARSETRTALPLNDNASISWILKERRPLAIEDVSSDPLLARVRPILERWSIRSILLAPLIVKGEVIGTIGLDSIERPRRFTSEELALAQTMANHVALALENAQLHAEIRNRLAELQRTKESLAAHATIAWMGMVDATWRHAIVNHALAIRTNIDTLRKSLPGQVLTSSTQEILSEIKRIAEMIQVRPITPPLSRQEGTVSVQVNDFLRERVRQIQENERFQLVHFEFLPGMDERVTVRVSREWIRNVFDILVDNAIEAMRHSSKKQITVTTRQADRWVHIEVIDTGHGIPTPIQNQFGHDKIAKAQGERGMGMGVLLAQTIIQTYGGKLEIGATASTGTTILVRLPVERIEGASDDIYTSTIVVDT